MPRRLARAAENPHHDRRGRCGPLRLGRSPTRCPRRVCRERYTCRSPFALGEASRAHRGSPVRSMAGTRRDASSCDLPWQSPSRAVIFVTVGTSTFPFDRLMRSVDELGLSDELVVQYGASEVIPRARVSRQFMAYPEVLEHMQHARTVVAHGGVGSILTALHAGKHPIVVPRRRQFAEAVDDHQVDLVTQLAQRGVVTLVDSLSELGSRIAEAPGVPVSAAASSSLAAAIAEFVDSVLGLAAR